MEHEKQVEVVKQALELETQIQVRLSGTAARSTGC